MNGLIGLLIFLFLFILVLLMITLMESNKKAKRLASFTVKEEEENHSLLGDLTKTFWNLMHSLSKGLPKTKWLKEESKLYEKYIPYQERNTRSGIDYITVKVFLLVIVLCIVIIGIVLELLPSNWLILVLAVLFSSLLPDYIWLTSHEKKLKKMGEHIYIATCNIKGELENKKTLVESITYAMDFANNELKDELAKIKQDIAHGVGVSKSFYRFYKRTHLKEAKLVYEMVVETEYLHLPWKEAFIKASTILAKENKKKHSKDLILERFAWIQTMTYFLPVLAILLGLYINYEKYQFFLTSKGATILIGMAVLYLVYTKVIHGIEGDSK